MRNTSKESVDIAFETLEALGFARKEPEETGAPR
jgi:hypothetical protein